MKKVLPLLIVMLLVLTACVAKFEAVEDAIEHKADAVEDAVTRPAPGTSAAAGTNLLPEEEAELIALEHAGFTADQVTNLRTSYDIDDGIPEYEIEFHVDRIEYEYTIHAETGDILEWDRGD